LRRELESPRPFGDVANELGQLLPEDLQLARALRVLADADRKRFWVKSQVLWFKRFGWRMIRPMMAVGLVAAAGFMLQSSIEPTRGLMLFLSGVASFYVMLQIYAHFWSRHDEKKLASTEAALASELREILRDIERDRR